MDFKSYPIYKDSGVEWIGNIPSHWSVKRFGYIFRENKIKNSALIETNVLSLSYGCIKEKNIEDNKGLLPESFETYQIIQPNDIIFRFTDLQNDKRSLRSAISKFHGIITSAYIGVRTTANAEFYNYLFRAYDQQKVFYSMGDGMRQSLKIDELNRMPIVFPSDVEQQQIVSFLDSETSRIDNLIAKQEKLIEKLEEHRKSVISHAVTKGLDPNVPMKDSGSEWLGEVAEHWDSCNLKFISKIYAGGTPDRNRLDYWAKGEIPWINSGAVNQVIIKEPSEYITELGLKNSSAKYIPVNSLVMALAGQGKTKGMVAYTSIETTCNQSMAAIVPKNYHYKFLYYWLDSNYQNIRNLTGGDNRDGLNLAVLSNIPCPKSSIVEQTQIVSFLDSETSRIDNLIAKQEKLIEKLKEYRTSIISYAVTGKIDVRDLVA